MKKSFRLFLVLSLFTLSGSAFALGTTSLTPWYADTPPDFCGPISGDRPCYVSTGVYIQCTAKGSEGQRCQKAVQDNGVWVCASVAYSAACQCNEATKQSTGSCQYYR